MHRQLCIGFKYGPPKVAFFRCNAIHELSLRVTAIKVTPFDPENSGALIAIFGSHVVQIPGPESFCIVSFTLSELYREILEDELERTIEFSIDKLGFERHQVIFQHDNDPKHTSKLVKEYLKDQSYNILELPAQSPDLNPIENMWSLLKRRLNDYETAPKGMNELYERVTKVWYDLMKLEECQKVIESMPKRIKQCIKNKGRWTDY
ncbi:hypothetical protein RO3G_16911 [Rhizopus delemar RA 99-880]|uniref:Tc1-like transposase DDE domain-containing protein n=1 Tax=Rhizopus delemar (strain RA 99-880 / ATCC MYA-4621 / FGSC 9543 / NRRL 43880) TaxID=246409 RepID=I1CUS0_RHIO9|nr:hypothetical protein RO3G_16911 [Rhizopus delemar RA 99-880]|eukprot:EIE92200.1 hypothetical protein RO3G_16911 [Rhizopus delemar RA 99-880]